MNEILPSLDNKDDFYYLLNKITNPFLSPIRSILSIICIENTSKQNLDMFIGFI